MMSRAWIGQAASASCARRRRGGAGHEDGYRGVTVAATGLMDLGSFHMAFDLPLNAVLHTRCHRFYDTAGQGESTVAFRGRVTVDKVLRP